MEGNVEAILCRFQSLTRLEFEKCKGLSRYGFWEQLLPSLPLLQDLTVAECLDSDDALQGLDLSVSPPHPSLQKLRLTVSLKTVLRNSPSHLILDLSQLPGQTLDHVGEGLSLDSTLRTLELVLPDEGWSNAQFKELCESLVRRSRMRSLTIASSYDEGDEEFSVWSCPVPPLLDLLLGCVALEELQLKGMHATSNFMTIYDYRSEPLRGSTLKQLKLGQCYIDDGKLATLGRLLTKISTNL